MKRPNLNIIIPLGGKGTRFSNHGYTIPKPLIKVLGIPMIFWVIKNLKITQEDTLTIFYNSDLNDYGFEQMVSGEYPFVTLVQVPNNTKGPIHTLKEGFKRSGHLKEEAPVVLIDGDTFYTKDIFSMYCEDMAHIHTHEGMGNCIFSFKTDFEDPIYSYIKTDHNGFVVDIAEKEKISDIANTGCYCFESIRELKSSIKDMEDSSFTSDIYKNFLGKKIIRSILLEENKDFYCIGTPDQLQTFCVSNENISQMRFCFDLDGTLVTLSRNGNYDDVRPILKNIKYIKHLKSLGHYIIIYTARRMKTHNGNVGRVIGDVAQITIDTLNSFEIPYDEIVFGKPHAHFYIDDLSISAYSDLNKETGFYNNVTEARSFNSVVIKDEMVYKESKSSDFDGELFFYKNIPTELSNYFPTLMDSDKNSITISKIEGTDLSHIYTSLNLDKMLLKKVFKSLNHIHSIFPPKLENFDRRSLYLDKLIERVESNLNLFEKYTTSFDFISFYEHMKHEIEIFSNQPTFKRVFHGDSVFSNIMVSNQYEIKFLDPRGKIGNELTIFGDPLYDYVKMYQSIVGYDFILLDKPMNLFYINETIKHFQELILEKQSTYIISKIPLLTASLLVSLVPLHDNEKCFDYLNLAYNVLNNKEYQLC